MLGAKSFDQLPTKRGITTNFKLKSLERRPIGTDNVIQSLMETSKM
jgi:hypothetical protein